MANVQPAGATTGAKAQNAEFFAADLLPFVLAQYAAKNKISISVSAAVVIEITLDSGSNWTALNAGVAIGVDQLFTFDVAIRNGDTFNMRTPTGGGATVDICRVDEVTSEA